MENCHDIVRCTAKMVIIYTLEWSCSILFSVSASYHVPSFSCVTALLRVAVFATTLCGETQRTGLCPF